MNPRLAQILALAEAMSIQIEDIYEEIMDDPNYGDKYMIPADPVKLRDERHFKPKHQHRFKTKPLPQRRIINHKIPRRRS